MLIGAAAFVGGPVDRRVVAYDGPVGRLVDVLVLVGSAAGDYVLRVRRPFGPDVYVPRHAVARVGEQFVLLKGTRHEIERIASTRRPAARSATGAAPTDA